MKIAVIHYTGTVGKTTIAVNGLAPRMKDAPVLAIETINQTGQELGINTQQLSADNFRRILRTLILEENVIIDVGASNIESFLEGMVRFEDSQNEFDYFVIPVTPGTKEQKETISLLTVMANMGIPYEKVKIVFNRVDVDVQEEFAPLLSFLQKEGTFTVNLDSVIYENEVFNLLNLKKMTISQIIEDPQDYRQKAIEAKMAGDQKLAIHFADMHLMKQLAIAVNRQLDRVYATLFN